MGFSNLNIQILPSSGMQRMHGVLTGLALVACWVSQLPVWVQLMLSVILLGIWQRTAGLNNRPLNLRYTADSGWQIQYDSEEYQSIMVLTSTVIFPFFIILHYCNAAQIRKFVLVAKDAVRTEDYRRLVVALKVDH